MYTTYIFRVHYDLYWCTQSHIFLRCWWGSCDHVPSHPLSIPLCICQMEKAKEKGLRDFRKTLSAYQPGYIQLIQILIIMHIMMSILNNLPI